MLDEDINKYIETFPIMKKFDDGLVVQNSVMLSEIENFKAIWYPSNNEDDLSGSVWQGKTGKYEMLE